MVDFISFYMFCGFLMFLLLLLDNVYNKHQEPMSMGDMINMSAFWPVIVYLFVKIYIVNKKKKDEQ